MSIADRQLRNALNNIIGEAMRGGRLPTLNELRRKLDKHFSKYALGQPTMQLRLLERRQQSDAAMWNETIDEVYEDLSVLYEEIVGKSELIISNFDYAETERRRLDRRLNELTSRIQDMLVLSGASQTYTHSFTESFNSLTMVDTDKSNCFVDLRAREVTPMPTKVGTVRLDLSNAAVEHQLLTTNGVINIETLSALSNILDDMQNTAWVSKVLTQTTQKVAHQITITPQEAVGITRISISPHNTDRVRMTVSVTEDGGNWRTLYNKITNDIVHIDLQPTRVVSLRIVLSKEDSDGSELYNGTLYEAYYMGLASVAMLHVGFEDAGTLYSRSITVTDNKGNPVNINKIALEVDHDVDPPYNWIKYYLALESETPRWIQVTPVNHAPDTQLDNRPPSVVDFKAIASVGRVEYNASVLEDPYSEHNGLPIYALAQLSPSVDQPIKESIDLRCGYRQWRQDQYMHQWDDEARHTPSGADWVALPGNITQEHILSKYISLHEDPNVSATLVADHEAHNYKWTTHVMCEQQKEVEANIITDAPGRVTIYVNNEEVIALHGKDLEANVPVSYSFSLARGTNVIQVLFYNLSTNGPCTINLGLYPLSNISQEIYAEINPLELVSEFDLCYNVRDIDTTKFALAYGRFILINEASKNMGGKYTLSYSYYPQGHSKRLLFRADMGKQSGSMRPPKLKSYSIRVI